MATIVTIEPRPDHGIEVTRLFEAHADWLRGYCLRRLGSPADAEDAVQTTFLHAFRALARGVEPECEEAWLTTIAKNACRTLRRTAVRRGETATDVDLDSIEARHVEDDDRDLLMDLGDAVASLPDRQREALVLRELRGMSSQEIASRLALTTPATHALLTRARRSLARALTVPRAAAGLDFGWLTSKLVAPLRLLEGGGTAKIAALGAAATLVTGGVAIEREGSSQTIERTPRAASSGPAIPTASSARSLAARENRTGARHRRTAVASRSSLDAAAPLPERPVPPVPIDEAPSGPTEVPVPPADDEGGGGREQPAPGELPPPAVELPPLPLDPPELALPALPPVALPPLPEPPVETPSLPALPTAEPDLPLP